MDNLKNTFLLLKKAIAENRRLRNIYLKVFSSFDYMYFLENLLTVEKNTYNYLPTDYSKALLEKDLISLQPPLKEFEIKIASSPYMEFLPDIKFAFSYKKEVRALTLEFNNNCYLTLTGQEGQETIKKTYCPKDNFYDLLTVIFLLMAGGVKDKKNLELIKENFPESCFYFKAAEYVLKNLAEIKQMWRGLVKRLETSFHWQNSEMVFANIVSNCNLSKIYSLENFPEENFNTHYSFSINEYNNELEFNLRELEDAKNKKSFYRNISKESYLKIPEFIGIYPNKNRLSPYKVFLRYNLLREKNKETVVLVYNAINKKLELEKDNYFNDKLKEGVEVFQENKVLDNLVEKVGTRLLTFYGFAKTKNEEMFEPIETCFTFINKILIDSCKVLLLISRF
jgi:hypothetical protein